MTFNNNRIISSLRTIALAMAVITSFLYQGARAGRFFQHIKKLLGIFVKICDLYIEAIQQETFDCYKISDKKFDTLRTHTKILHSSLPYNSLFSYSVLIPVYHPKVHYLRQAIQSVLNQTAPQIEVLVGFDGPQPGEIYDLVEELKKNNSQLKSFQLDRGGISATTNALAKIAKGNFLVLMDHDDWVRPDLLYHYELALRVFTHPENLVLYCNEFLIDENDFPIIDQHSNKPSQPHFPYFFINSVCHCLLVPKLLWDRAEGLRSSCDGGQDYDLVLRLNLLGAQFKNIPLYLYAWRSHASSTAQNIQIKPYAIKAPIKALNDFCLSQKLDWNITDGFLPTTYRAIPALYLRPSVQIIIPYEGNLKQTVNTIEATLQQEGVAAKITVVGSNIKPKDQEKFKSLQIAMYSWEEPFHLPKFYNKAVNNTAETDLILFLRSGIFLEKDALLEMSRWIYQPKIGIVGCLLMDSKGLLFHGGIQEKTDPYSLKGVQWNYIEQGLSGNQLCVAKQLRVAKAISTQCGLVQRKLFQEIGGFDEIDYTNLCQDIQLSLKYSDKGYFSFYTPYAKGRYDL